MEQDTEYQQFQKYDFENDGAFQQGLNTIMQNIQAAEQDQESVKLNAQLFYYNKHHGTQLDLQGYQSWRNNQESSTNSGISQDDQKALPNSYNDIVEMILSGKPIPGIKEIPNTVLGEEASSESSATERKKPWEQ